MHELGKKMIKSSLWLTILRISNKMLGLVRRFVLARLLSPNDFGIMGVALLAMSLLETFTETGFKDILIQKQNRFTEFLNSIWTLQIVRAVIVFLLIMILAPYIALFFNEGEYTVLIIRIIAFSILLKGFTNSSIHYFKKEIEFSKDFIFQFSGVAANTIVSIILAIIYKSVWALVIGTLVADLVMLIVSFMISPHKVKIEFNKKKISNIISTSWWYIGLGVTFFLATQGDDTILGREFGATELAFYQMAFTVANIGVTEVSKVFGNVFYPVYCMCQNDVIKQRSTFASNNMIISSLVMPYALGLSLVAPLFINVVLGENWISVLDTLYVLILAGVIRAITSDSLFKSINRPDISFKRTLVRVIVMLVCIYPLLNLFGSIGVAYSVLLGLLGSLPLWIIQLKKNFQITLLDIIKNMLPAIIGTTIMGLSVVLLNIIDFNTAFLKLLFSSIIGIVVYFMYTIIIYLLFKKGLINEIRNGIFSRNYGMGEK